MRNVTALFAAGMLAAATWFVPAVAAACDGGVADGECSDAECADGSCYADCQYFPDECNVSGSSSSGDASSSSSGDTSSSGGDDGGSSSSGDDGGSSSSGDDGGSGSSGGSGSGDDGGSSDDGGCTVSPALGRTSAGTGAVALLGVALALGRRRRAQRS